MNFFRTMLLLAALTALFMAIGGAIGGGPGMTIAFVIAAGMNLFAYWNSDKMVLAQQDARGSGRAPGARALRHRAPACGECAAADAARLYHQHRSAERFRHRPQPENAAVAASSGLLRMMSKEEIAGVLGHELAHVKNRDTLTMTVAATIAGAISMLANFGMFFGGSRRDGEGGGPGIVSTLLAIIVAPIAAALIQMALSRSREYAADRDGAVICGHPLWLASALQKIESAARRNPQRAGGRHPASASLYIVNPLSGAGHGQSVLDAPEYGEPHCGAGGAGPRDGRDATAQRRRLRCACR